MQSSCLLGLFWLRQFLRPSLFDDLNLGRSPVRCLQGVPLLGCAEFFSRSQWGDGFAKVKRPSHPILSRVLLSTRLVTVGVDLGHLAEACLSGSPLHRYQLPLSTPSSSEGSPCTAHTCGVGVLLQLWRAAWGTAHRKWDPSARERVFADFTDPIIDLYQHELTDTSGYSPTRRDLLLCCSVCPSFDQRGSFSGSWVPSRFGFGACPSFPAL